MASIEDSSPNEVHIIIIREQHIKASHIYGRVNQGLFYLLEQLFHFERLYNWKCETLQFNMWDYTMLNVRLF